MNQSLTHVFRKQLGIKQCQTNTFMQLEINQLNLTFTFLFNAIINKKLPSFYSLSGTNRYNQSLHRACSKTSEPFVPYIKIKNAISPMLLCDQSRTHPGLVAFIAEASTDNHQTCYLKIWVEFMANQYQVRLSSFEGKSTIDLLASFSVQLKFYSVNRAL